MRKILTLLLFTISLNIYSTINIHHTSVDKDTLEILQAKDMLQGKRTMVALTFGQSNAANNGQSPYSPKHSSSVYNYYQGKLFTAQDPLKGATSSGGSVWTHLADTLIAGEYYDKVILVPIAVGGSSIECWSNGDCSNKLIETLKMLDKQDVKLTHIFWHQGETDNLSDTPLNIYKERMDIILNTIRSYNQDADIYISLASYHPGSPNKPLGVDETIRQAQKEIINDNNKVLLGPDTDTLIHAIHRYDGVHFSNYGLKLYSNLWLDALINKSENVRK